jgi:hypothetical protein
MRSMISPAIRVFRDYGAEVSRSRDVGAWQSLLDSGFGMAEWSRMSTVHLVGGEKGGVGKSVVARLITQLFIDRSLPFSAFDADQSHGALLRYYSDYARAVDLSVLSSADEIMDSALAAERSVVVDLPAQSVRSLSTWLESTDVLAFARESDVRFVFWHVTDGGFDSVAQLEQQLERHGGELDYVVVENEGRSKSFRQLEGSPAYERLNALGGRVIRLPELDPAVMYELDRFGSSFWAAVNTSEGPRALSPMARRRAQKWLEQSFRALEQLGYWAGNGQRPAAPAPVRQAEVEGDSSQPLGVN